MLVLSIGLSYETIYADHPEPVELTFDKESYEFGDTMIITTKVPSPWFSPGFCEDFFHVVIINTPSGSNFTPVINATGHSTIITVINSTELVAQEFESFAYLQYSTEVVTERCQSENHATSELQNISLNSDHDSMLLQHIVDIPAVNATAQNNTASITTLDSQMNIIHTNMTIAETQITDLNSLFISLNNTLTEHKIIIDILTFNVTQLMGQLPPLPLDAPIITLLTANDPDDLDEILSNGDTVTIQFDSDTNEPGGNGIQTKSDIDDLFDFSDTVGQAYSGQWITPDTFMITINSISSSKLALNSTTVTPAQITLILPADNNQEKFSHETSLALSGDWGILVPSITSATAYDPDNADSVYSVGDGIILAFDIDTNMPGGENVIQDKQACDDMLTSSDNLGADYTCEWTNENQMVYAILNITNAAPPEIGVTTLTPTGTTPILSADETSGPSITTSPPISNTWGSG